MAGAVIAGVIGQTSVNEFESTSVHPGGKGQFQSVDFTTMTSVGQPVAAGVRDGTGVAEAARVLTGVCASDGCGVGFAV